MDLQNGLEPSIYIENRMQSGDLALHSRIIIIEKG